MTSENTGVKLFNIPANPEEMPVSAYVKRNAGKKFPQNPTTVRGTRFFRCLSRWIFGSAKGSRASDAINIRSAPTCASLKMVDPSAANIPFFININELPQVSARRSKIPQLISDFDMA